MNAIEIKNLKKYFPIYFGFPPRIKNWIKAVDGVTLNIKKGEALGIVGESGCGKSTLVNTILRLEEQTSGEVILERKNIFRLNKKEMSKLKKEIQIVFQDPFWSLNPRWLIKDIVGEPLYVHLHLTIGELLSKVEELLHSNEEIDNYINKVVEKSLDPYSMANLIIKMLGNKI